MEEKQYKITIDTNVNITGQAGSELSNRNVLQQGNSMQQGVGVGGAISAQMLVAQTSRLLDATGNQEVANMMQKTSRYTFLGMRALSGDITAQLNLAVSLATMALQEVRKQADFSNETDNARIKAGLMDMQGVKVSKNWLTGVQTYSRG